MTCSPFTSPLFSSKDTLYYATSDLPFLKKRTEEEITKDKQEQKTQLYNDLYDSYTTYVSEGELSSDDFFEALKKVTTDEFVRSEKEYTKAFTLMSKFKKEQTVFS